MSGPQPWSGPGVIFTFFKVPESSKVSQHAIEKWFDEEYVPKLLETGVVKSGWLYKAANPEYDKQHLLIYKVSDFAQAGKLKEVPRTSEKGLFDGDVHSHIEFESRIYSFVQLYETSKQDEGA